MMMSTMLAGLAAIAPEPTFPFTPPAIPPALRSFVRVEGRCIVVKTLRGPDIRDCPEDADNYFEYHDFDSFAGGRLVGYRHVMNDGYGYMLVDRAGSGAGAMTETGDKPIFSPDGRFFASTLTGSSLGFFRGIGLWAVEPDRVRAAFFTNAGDDWDWEIQSFASPRCVIFKATRDNGSHLDPAQPGGVSPPDLVSEFYTLTFGEGVSLARADTPACPAPAADAR